MKKELLNSVLNFPTFAKLFQEIHAHMGIIIYHTNVFYYHGAGEASSPHDIRWGRFNIDLTNNQLSVLKEKMIVIEPFETPDGKVTTYEAVILNITGLYENFEVVLHEVDYFSAGKVSVDRQIFTPDIETMTSVLILFPMTRSLSENGTKELELQYSFEKPMYNKEGKTYLGFSKHKHTVGDTRD